MIAPICKAVLAPELVQLGAVLGVAVGYDVSAVAASYNEDFAHLMIRQIFLVALDVSIVELQDHVACFAVIDCFEDRPFSLVEPAFSHDFHVLLDNSGVNRV